jgi:pyruvate-formate lyase-activating enzyme
VPFTDADLLTEHVDTVLLAATTNCNLRCTYCAVSLPSYVGEDFDFGRVEQLADEMARAHVSNVQISGHGETTIIPHWESYCRAFQDRGIAVCITSNFSKVFTEPEVDALARMNEIIVSIDTADRELLRQIRRKVDLRTILYNMQLVRLRSRALHSRGPRFNWQCTLSDRVVSGLMEWTELGLLNSVSIFTLGNLIEHKELNAVLTRDNVPLARHVAKLEREPLLAACKSISAAVARARSAGAMVMVQSGIIEGINESLSRYGEKERFDVPTGPSAIANAARRLRRYAGLSR